MKEVINMAEKKVIIFNGKMFYNARHLHDHLVKYYSVVHKVTYLKVRESTGKRLKSIDKTFKVEYELVSATKKASLKRYMQISEGQEEIIAFEVKKFDDFVIKYLGLKDVGYLFTYKNPRKEIMLAYKDLYLLALIRRYNEELHMQIFNNIKEASTLDGEFYRYILQPSPIKQNLF